MQQPSGYNERAPTARDDDAAKQLLGYRTPRSDHLPKPAPSPSRTRVGVRVVRGRRPGASADGAAGSRDMDCARVPMGKPSSGITGEDCSQPPDGVAAPQPGLGASAARLELICAALAAATAGPALDDHGGGEHHHHHRAVPAASPLAEALATDAIIDESAQ